MVSAEERRGTGEGEIRERNMKEGKDEGGKI